MPDVELFVDPVCPFCWQTSKWLRQVQRLEDLDVGWRFISLAMVNEEAGYDGMPEHYPAVLAVHAAGLDLRPALVQVGLPEALAAAAEDRSHDLVLRRETDDALARAGADVGTPIVAFAPPDGPAFFGLVISDLPSDEDAVAYYRALELLARWPGFAELEWPLRTMPDVQMLAALRRDAA